MTFKSFHKIRSLCQAWLDWLVVVWRLAKAGSGALALGALWLLAGSCMATASPTPARLSTSVFAVPGARAAVIAGNHCSGLVIVELKGRGAQGFRFRIVLNSATRVAESSLDLAAPAAGLLVTARDVDGIGNDLDLIIKSANSF